MKFYEQWVEDNESLEVIDMIDELLNEITYAYDPMYPIRKDIDGIYHVHKLAIGKNWCQYKEHITRLSPGIYEQLEEFFNIRIEV